MISSSKCNPKCPRHGKVSIFLGMMDFTTIFLRTFALIKTELFRNSVSIPRSTSCACSRFPMVAEIPQMRNWGEMVFKRDNPSSICTPRLLPSSSCHSSTTTAFSGLKVFSYPLLASNSIKLSGVVIRRSGMLFFCCALIF